MLYNLIGQKFGRLKVTEFHHKDEKYRSNYWKCLCDCGKITVVSTSALRRKNRPSESCGCLTKERLLEKHHFGRKEFRTANLNSLFYTYKKSAKSRNIEFKLTREKFIELTSQLCFYCDIEPNQIHCKKETNGPYIYNGIDRVDSLLGYVEENVVTCCKVCNYAKREMTQKEFYNWIKRVYTTSSCFIED